MFANQRISGQFEIIAFYFLTLKTANEFKCTDERNLQNYTETVAKMVLMLLETRRIMIVRLLDLSDNLPNTTSFKKPRK